MQACGNCHSDHTDWPWYGHGCASLLVGSHGTCVKARKQLDFSQWESYSARQKIDKIGFHLWTQYRRARMPPWAYTAMHPEAKLTEENKNADVVAGR